MSKRVIGKTTDMALIEMRDPRGRKIEAIIRDAFAEGGGKQVEAARIIGIDASTLSRWLTRLNLQRESKIRRVPREKREGVPA